MDWLDDLQGQIIALDTAPLIYFIEEHPKYTPTVTPFFNALATAQFQAITSVITLLEVLVLPYRSGNATLAAQYQEILLNTPSLTIQPLTPDIAEEAARIRALHGIRTPDAIQLATAVLGSAKAILTNDTNLPAIPGLQVLVLDRLL